MRRQKTDSEKRDEHPCKFYKNISSLRNMMWGLLVFHVTCFIVGFVLMCTYSDSLRGYVLYGGVGLVTSGLIGMFSLTCVALGLFTVVSLHKDVDRSILAFIFGNDSKHDDVPQVDQNAVIEGSDDQTACVSPRQRPVGASTSSEETLAKWNVIGKLNPDGKPSLAESSPKAQQDETVAQVEVHRSASSDSSQFAMTPTKLADPPKNISASVENLFSSQNKIAAIAKRLAVSLEKLDYTKFYELPEDLAPHLFDCVVRVEAIANYMEEPSLKASKLFPKSSNLSRTSSMPVPKRVLPSPQKSLPSPERSLPSPERSLPSPGRSLKSPESVVYSPGRSLPTPEKLYSTPERTLPSLESSLQSPERSIQLAGRSVQSLEDVQPSPVRTLQYPLRAKPRTRPSMERIFLSPKRVLPDIALSTVKMASPSPERSLSSLEGARQLQGRTRSSQGKSQGRTRSSLEKIFLSPKRDLSPVAEILGELEGSPPQQGRSFAPRERTHSSPEISGSSLDTYESLRSHPPLRRSLALPIRLLPSPMEFPPPLDGSLAAPTSSSSTPDGEVESAKLLGPPSNDTGVKFVKVSIAPGEPLDPGPDPPSEKVDTTANEPDDQSDASDRQPLVPESPKAKLKPTGKSRRPSFE